MSQPTHTCHFERTPESTGRLEAMGYTHDYENAKEH